MVFGKILGLGDLACALTIVLFYFHLIEAETTLWAVGYLVVKGLIFFANLNSKVDMLVGLFLLAMAFGLVWKLGVILSCIWLVQKAVFSML